MYNVEKGRGLRGDFVSISLPVTADYRIESANYITCINPMLHPNRIMEYHDFLYIIEGEWEIIENDIVYFKNGSSLTPPKKALAAIRSQWLDYWLEGGITL